MKQTSAAKAALRCAHYGMAKAMPLQKQSAAFEKHEGLRYKNEPKNYGGINSMPYKSEQQVSRRNPLLLQFALQMQRERGWVRNDNKTCRPEGRRYNKEQQVPCRQQARRRSSRDAKAAAFEKREGLRYKKTQGLGRRKECKGATCDIAHR